MPSDPGTLLLKAVRSLPPHEQDELLGSVLGRLLTPGSLHTSAQPAGAEVSVMSHPESLQQSSLSRVREMLREMGLASSAGPQQLVPVRLSEEQHRRLKDWCAENNFKMAVVLRGLVERFLEEQKRRAS